MIYDGACHCGTIRFQVEADEHMTAVDCNCSICVLMPFPHLIIPKSKFTLLAGQEQLSTYNFGTGIAQHTFCAVCGIKPFYTPRSNPDGIDVNANCLSPKPLSLTIKTFDGEHWEQHAHTLARLSKEPS